MRKKLDQLVTTDFNRQKTSNKEFFVYAHSQQIYLLDKEGLTRALYYTGTPIREIQKSIQELINEN